MYFLPSGASGDAGESGLVIAQWLLLQVQYYRDQVIVQFAGN